MSVFTLEALDARYGDCLLLHFGERDRPSTLLIDGGPSGTFEILASRLEEVRARYWSPEALPLPLVVNTHIDADHIAGLIEMAESMSHGPFGPQLQIGNLWHNSFEDAVAVGVESGLTDDEVLEIWAHQVGSSTGSRSGNFVIASVPQAHRLSELARDLDWPINRGFDGLVRAEDRAANQRSGALSLRVLLPDERRLVELAKEFENQAMGREGAVTPDDTATNLASIVCLVELEGKTMLLTGDARDDHIVEALEEAGLLQPGGACEPDLLKLPHHGSIRNAMSSPFFERVRAKHYVISADGRNGNPDVPTLRKLSRARPDDDFTIHMTYGPQMLREPARAAVSAFLASEHAAGRRYRVQTRIADKPSITVDLLDPMG